MIVGFSCFVGLSAFLTSLMSGVYFNDMPMVEFDDLVVIYVIWD